MATVEKVKVKRKEQPEQSAAERLLELCETLEDQPHIEKIWFDAKGNHFFVAREFKGKFYSRLKVVGKDTKDASGNIRTAAAYETIPGTELVRSETRAEVLKRKPEVIYE